MAAASTRHIEPLLPDAAAPAEAKPKTLILIGVGVLFVFFTLV